MKSQQYAKRIYHGYVSLNCVSIETTPDADRDRPAKEVAGYQACINIFDEHIYVRDARM